MRTVEIYNNGVLAGTLEERDQNHYRFIYAPGYRGEPVSLTLPVREAAYEFDKFPPVFEGVLPEGVLLDALLRQHKIDKRDMFQQLVIVGKDLVGSNTVSEGR